MTAKQLMRLTKKELVEKLERIYAEYQKLTVTNTSNYNHLSRTEKERDDLKAEIEVLQRGVDNYTATTGHLRRAVEDLEKNLETQESLHGTLMKECKSIKEEYGELENRFYKLKDSSSSNSVIIKMQEKDIESLKKERDVLKEEIKDLRTRANQELANKDLYYKLYTEEVKTNNDLKEDRKEGEQTIRELESFIANLALRKGIK